MGRQSGKKNKINMEDYGLVSIVMPSYNCEQYIEASIHSVIAQSYDKWELLIVDDCSSDRTVDVIKKFNDQRIKLFVNDHNSGAAISRNKALMNATGRWLAFLDSDDVWASNKLEVQLHFMCEHNYMFSYTDYRIFAKGQWGKKIITAPNKLNFRTIKRYCYCFTSTVVYRHDLIGLIQISDLKKNNDYAMWLHALGKVDGYRLNKCLSAYIKRNGSISSSRKTKLIKWHYRLFRQEMNYNYLHSFYMVIKNIWFGFWKKLFYRRKIKADEITLFSEVK